MNTGSLIIRAIDPAYARMDPAESARLFVPRAQQAVGHFDTSGGRKQVGVVQIVGPTDKILDLQVRDEVNALAAHESVGEILVYIDSPGGTVQGAHDLYESIRRASAVKRVTAFAEDTCASAAYEAACGATEIVCNPTCAVGSIGTYVVMADASRMFEKMGVDIIVVRSGPNKGTGIQGAKITAEEVAQVQQYVDSINRHFLAAVAKGRRMSIERVRDVADGRVFVGAEAVAAGLADRVAMFEDVLGEIAERNAPKPALSPAVQAQADYAKLVAEYGPETARKIDLIKGQAAVIAENEQHQRRVIDWNEVARLERSSVSQNRIQKYR